MKRYLQILLILFSTAVSAQSLYSRPSSGATFQNDGEITVEATRSAYGITLNKKFESLPYALKNKIINYLGRTSRSEFKGMGTVRLPIVKRSGAYYVVVDNSYNNLDPL